MTTDKNGAGELSDARLAPHGSRELTALIERACPECGGTIPRMAGEFPWQYNRRRFCSRVCGSRSANRERSTPVADRLRSGSVVNEITGCWEWTGTLKADGYGKISIGSKADTTHRAAYREWIGPIAPQMHVCHRCDNRRCINPAHLFLGTNAENTADRDDKGRQARGEASGRAKLTEADVRAIRSSDASIADLARCYGVGETTISSAKHRRTWTHVE